MLYYREIIDMKDFHDHTTHPVAQGDRRICYCRHLHDGLFLHDPHAALEDIFQIQQGSRLQSARQPKRRRDLGQTLAFKSFI